MVKVTKNSPTAQSCQMAMGCGVKKKHDTPVTKIAGMKMGGCCMSEPCCKQSACCKEDGTLHLIVNQSMKKGSMGDQHKASMKNKKDPISRAAKMKMMGVTQRPMQAGRARGK